jgi:hypothetical protein
MFKLRPSRRLLGLLAALLALGAAIVGGAVAAFPQDNVKLYTGCLTSGGSLVSVAEGDNPLQACASPKQVVKLSGGDITSLTVTAPLTGGGTNGALTIGLNASQTLPTCSADNAVPKWNLSTSRWTCGTDDDTTYTAGTGLDLSASPANAFSIEPAYRIPGKACSTSGQFATGFDSSGSIKCAAPASNGVQAYSTTVGATILAGETTVISKTLPAGKYLLFASVALANQDGSSSDHFSQASCAIPGFTTGTVVLFYPAEIVSDIHNQLLGTVDSVSLASAIDHPGGAVELKCTEEEPDVDVHQATLTAIRVDSLG